MSGFEFVDELPGDPYTTNSAVFRGRILKEFVAALRENPGQWAKYPFTLTAQSITSRASGIRTNKLGAFREGTFEATGRDGVLYVRAVKS